MSPTIRTLTLAGLAAPMFACAIDSADPSLVGHSQALEEKQAPPTTIVTKMVPDKPPRGRTEGNPAFPRAARKLLEKGYGRYTMGPGDRVRSRTVDGEDPASPGPNARRLVRFAHLADLQVLDDEAMTRAGIADKELFAALRPQDPYVCHLANAAVRAIDDHHAHIPIDFTLLGGDNIDNAQANELDWLLKILAGESVHCDSGKDDDLVPGEQDAKDPFETVGLKMPWYWVTGNHDELVQGNLEVNPLLRANAKGGGSLLGTRDYNRGGAPRFGIFFHADKRRRPMYPKELLRRVADNGDGHGITPEQAETGKAFYHFDVPGTEVRFIVLDTASETGGHSGVLRRSDFECFVLDALQGALDQNRVVILVSHHDLDALTTNGGPAGRPVKDAMTSAELLAELERFPNVLFNLVGHGHANSVQFVGYKNGGGYWEVQTAAIIDFPHQFRLMELWDADNGSYMLRATGVEVETRQDPVAEQGRVHGILDFTSDWGGFWPAGERDQNVEVWAKAPPPPSGDWGAAD